MLVSGLVRCLIVLIKVWYGALVLMLLNVAVQNLINWCGMVIVQAGWSVAVNVVQFFNLKICHTWLWHGDELLGLSFEKRLGSLFKLDDPIEILVIFNFSVLPFMHVCPCSVALNFMQTKALSSWYQLCLMNTNNCDNWVYVASSTKYYGVNFVSFSVEISVHSNYLCLNVFLAFSKQRHLMFIRKFAEPAL